jgi:NADH:ubiquinone oxidoreductase subunit 4 (subunit M)
VRLSCLRQIDIKLLIASSSVVHIRICIGGLFVLREWGLKGTVAVMLGHGLCSSGLFYLANVVYERTGRRSISISKGLLRLIPRICLWWFILLASNIAAPPRLNLFGEILLIRVLVSWRKVSIVIIGFLSFFRAAYRLYLFSLRQHGVYLYRKRGFHRGCILEYTVARAHWLPLNLVIICILWLIC